MPKADRQQLLDELKQTHKAARALKAGVVQYEKTAAKKSGAIDKLLVDGKKKIDDVVTELKGRFTKESSTLKTSVKTEKDTVESIRKDAKDHYNRFNQTYTAAMNKRSGVEAKHSKIVKLADEAATNANEISKHQTKAANAKAVIDELLKTSRKNDKDISTIHGEAERVSEEIKNTYAITLDTTMAGTLVDRRNALKKRTDLWEKVYLGSIGAIVVAIILALVVSKPDSFAQVITERLVFVTPLVLVAFVLGKQYNHERKLYEEYAFKAAAALSLRGYTILLNSEFKDIESARLEILRFTIGAMEGIYDREPLVQSPSTLHLMLGNNLAKFEAKLEDTVHKTANEAAKEAVDKLKDKAIVTNL